MTRATDPDVIAAYFATMRQFLATQSRVMSSFLGGMPAGSEPLALPMAAPAMPVVEPQAAPQAPAPQPVVAPAPAVAVPLAAPMPAASAPQYVAPAANDRDGMSHAALVDLLLGLVEEKTGYPRDMVGLGQNLEADLGIDSIKRIAIVGGL
jgi:hypothetical protein